MRLHSLKKITLRQSDGRWQRFILIIMGNLTLKHYFRLKVMSTVIYQEELAVLLKSWETGLTLRYCCRNTFSVNCEASGVPSTVTASIGLCSGASLGLSNEMLSYGEESLDGSEVVQQLYRSR